MPSHHPSITPGVEKALLNGGPITSVYSHKGEPGGKNNDCLILTMESGERVVFNIYSLYTLDVKVVTHAQ